MQPTVYVRALLLDCGSTEAIKLSFIYIGPNPNNNTLNGK